MARHLVADLWIFVSKTGGSTETRQPDALFLSSALHISLFSSLLAFPFCFSSIRKASVVAAAREDRGARP